MSKVENCHEGAERISLGRFSEKFVSWSAGDVEIKVWKEMNRKKQSVLDV